MTYFLWRQISSWDCYGISKRWVKKSPKSQVPRKTERRKGKVIKKWNCDKNEEKEKWLSFCAFLVFARQISEFRRSATFGGSFFPGPVGPERCTNLRSFKTHRRPKFIFLLLCCQRWIFPRQTFYTVCKWVLRKLHLSDRVTDWQTEASIGKSIDWWI